MKQILLALSLILLPPAASAQSHTAPSTSPLQQQLFKLVTGFPGRVGVFVQDGNSQASLKAASAFPLQSVMKLVVAAAVLDKVDRGKLHLTDKLIVHKSNLSVYNQPLAALVTVKGYETTLSDIVRRAIVDSDNAAADILFIKAGSQKGIAAFLTSKGLTGVRVDRQERQLQTEILGLKFRTAMADPKVFDAELAKVPKSLRDTLWKRYLLDPRDTASPSGMGALLKALSNGKLLSKDSTAFLLGAMHDTKVSADRLPAGLAPGWSIAHKSGTSGTWAGLAAATNDVGILTAPDGAKIIVVVFVADSTAPPAQRAALIAGVAKTIVANHVKA